MVMELWTYPVVLSIFVHEQARTCSIGNLLTSRALGSTECNQVVCDIPECYFITECNCEHSIYISNEDFTNMHFVYDCCNCSGSALAAKYR
jgi:hypothetical protein